MTVGFRYEYKFDGKKRDKALGTWPKKALADIRAERDRIRVLVTEGVDPTAADRAERIERQRAIEEIIRQEEELQIESLTINDLFEAWLTDGVARQDGNAELRRLFSKDVLPEIGNKTLSDLSDKDILAMLRKMLRRGVTRLVVVAYNDLNQMLAWGERRQPWRALNGEVGAHRFQRGDVAHT